MATFLTPDPYNSQATKQAMTRRVPPTAPFDPQMGAVLTNYGWTPSMQQRAQDAAAATSKSFNAAPNVVQKATIAATGSEATPVDPAAPTTTPTVSPNTAPVAPSMNSITASNNVALDANNERLGMRRLSPGVVRSSIPGVYLARGKDGSFMASNVVGADGQPEFAADAQERALANTISGGRGGGGSVVDPRAQVTDMYGWTQGPGSQAGVPDPQSGQVDPRGMAAAPGAAGYTWANPTGNEDVHNDIVNATNPFQIQGAMEQLAQRIKDNPNANNPQVKAANNMAMQRLSGAYNDKLRQFYGSAAGPMSMEGSMMAGMGLPVAPGMLGAGGKGMNPAQMMKDLADIRTGQQNADSRAAKVQADAVLKQEAQNETQAQNIFKANASNQALQKRLLALGINPNEYARMQQFTQNGGDIRSANPEATAMRNRVLRMVASGLAGARGPLDKLGNAVGVDQRPFIDVNDQGAYPGYSMTTDTFGNPILKSADGNYVNLGGGHRLRQMFGYGDTNPMLRTAYNDPVLGQIIRELAQPSGMSRKTANG